MEIVNATSTESAVFYIGTGEQVTLVAHGLADDDVVNIQILDIEDNIQKVGNPCCPLHPVDLKITNIQPLACQNGRTMKLTAIKPFCVIDGPQNVPMRVEVAAAPAAIVTVDLVKSDGTPCTSCSCECVDEEWVATGQTRCTDTKTEAEEVSNCGTTRWTETGDVTWTATGLTRCKGTSFEEQEANDCGALRWTANGTVGWTPTGDTRCNNDVIEQKEISDCGGFRWTQTADTCFCASYPLLAGGYGFVEGDAKDPAATVEIAPCDTGAAQTVYLYPSPRKGATAEQRDCDGVVIGYGMNQSPCAINKNNNAVTDCGTCNC